MKTLKQKIMAGEKNRKMDDPVLTSLLLDRNMIVRLDRQARLVSKRNGIKASRSDLIRAVINNYLSVTAGI